MPLDHTARSTLRERLGYYAFGVAIGLVMVGLIFSARAARQHAANPPAPTPPAPVAAP